MSQPYKCPVCNGTGYVPANFYSLGHYTGSLNPVVCKSCKGTGIVR